MAIETTANRISYSGDGSTTAFAFPYKFLANGDLKVYIRTTATGVETLKTITTHYTVAGAGEDAGGTVTMLVAPTSGETLIIYNDPTPTQGVDLRENDSLPAESVEQALDRLTVLVQRLKDRVDRSVRLSDAFSPTFDPLLPSDLDDAAGKIPLINQDGDGFADASEWPDSTLVTAAMAASQAAAAASAAAAATSAAAAATAETNAETAETNAETAETNAETAEAAAAASAAAAAASASAAANSAAATIWRDVVFITVANSPFTVTNSHRGKLIAVDTSGGNVTMTLPQISGLDLTSPFVVGIKKTSGDGNNLTINRAGTDTIDGSTSKVVSTADSGAVLIPDTDTAPDEWTSADFGSSAGNLTVDRFSGNGSTTGFTLSVDPGSENNTFVYVDGVYQQKDTYSISGTTLTFSAAPPTGTNNIEVIVGTLLSIGTPSDGTVGAAKLAYSAVNGQTAETSIATDDEVLIGDTSAAGLKKATVANLVAGGAASQAEMESAAATNRVVTPGRLKNHPGVAKVWAIWNGTGTVALAASHNVSSIGDNGTGNYTVNFTTAFSSGSIYSAHANPNEPGGAGHMACLVSNNAGSCNVRTYRHDGTATDNEIVTFTAFGDQ